MPCIQTGTGICHIYVDESADLDMALDIIENAKTSRPSVCNAAEVLLVHRAAAPRFLPMLQKRLCGPGAKHPVRLRCDEEAAAILGIHPWHRYFLRAGWCGWSGGGRRGTGGEKEGSKKERGNEFLFRIGTLLFLLSVSYFVDVCQCTIRHS